MDHRNPVPVAPFVALLDELREGQAWTDFAHLCGITDRTLRAWMNGHREWVQLEVADRVLTNLGMCHLWHTEDFLIQVGEYLDTYVPRVPAAR